MTQSVPNVSQSWQGAGPPVHFVFRFLQASHAAEIRALLVFFRDVSGFEGWLSLAGFRGRALDD
jgi:hypothetical protein